MYLYTGSGDTTCDLLIRLRPKCSNLGLSGSSPCFNERVRRPPPARKELSTPLGNATPAPRYRPDQSRAQLA